MDRYLDDLYRRSGVTLYTVREIALRDRSMTVRQLHRCIRKGYLKGIRVRGQWCVEARELDRFTENQDEYTKISVR